MFFSFQGFFVVRKIIILKTKLLTSRSSIEIRFFKSLDPDPHENGPVPQLRYYPSSSCFTNYHMQSELVLQISMVKLRDYFNLINHFLKFAFTQPSTNFVLHIGRHRKLNFTQYESGYQIPYRSKEYLIFLFT